MNNLRGIVLLLIIVILVAVVVIVRAVIPATTPPIATATVSVQAVSTEILDAGIGKQTIQRLENAINQDDKAAISALYASDYIGHIPENPIFDTTIDTKQITELLSLLHAAIPNMHVESDFIIEEGNIVAERVLFSGDFQGEFYDFPPTNGHIEFAANVFHQVDASGKITEQWIEFDSQNVLRQFGVS
jgi:hypothetical protein